MKCYCTSITAHPWYRFTFCGLNSSCGLNICRLFEGVFFCSSGLTQHYSATQPRSPTAGLFALQGCRHIMHHMSWGETSLAAGFTRRTPSPVAIIWCRCQLKRGKQDKEEKEKAKEVHDDVFLSMKCVSKGICSSSLTGRCENGQTLYIRLGVAKLGVSVLLIDLSQCLSWLLLLLLWKQARLFDWFITMCVCHIYCSILLLQNMTC